MKYCARILTFIEVLVKYFTSHAYCLKSVEYTYIIMHVQAIKPFQVISNNLIISSDTLIHPKNLTAI